MNVAHTFVHAHIDNDMFQFVWIWSVHFGGAHIQKLVNEYWIRNAYLYRNESAKAIE